LSTVGAKVKFWNMPAIALVEPVSFANACDIVILARELKLVVVPIPMKPLSFTPPIYRVGVELPKLAIARAGESGFNSTDSFAQGDDEATPRLEVKRFVDDAVVAKKLVVVAEVPVAFTKVKF
jgi:hypothetical protein